MLRKNEIVPLEITDLTHEGNGVGRHEGMAVFVPGAAPGDVLRCRIVKPLGRYAWGKVEQVVTPGTGRVRNDCPVWPRCGGCSLRHLSYECECAVKDGWVRENLARIGGLEPAWEPIIPSPSPARYRNKAQYPVQLVDGKVRVGLYAKRTHALVAVDDCLLQPEFFGTIARCVREFLQQHGIRPYDETDGSGLVRHLYIRWAETTGQVLVCLVINGKALPRVEELADELQADCPAVAVVALNHNTCNTNVILGEHTTTVRGSGWIEDELCGVRVRLSPTSFYQVNRRGAEALYRQALAYAEPRPGETLLDLYCGAGAIGLSMAGAFDRVIGVETLPAAVADARRTAERMGADNTEFLCDDAAGASERLRAQGLQPGVVVVDPPRKGVDEATLGHIAAMEPRRVVYVSCNSATLARDAQRLEALGYAAVRGRAVDLFPRTAHVEAVMQLDRVAK